jgi:hypothetical protein
MPHIRMLRHEHGSPHALLGWPGNGIGAAHCSGARGVLARTSLSFLSSSFSVSLLCQASSEDICSFSAMVRFVVVSSYAGEERKGDGASWCVRTCRGHTTHADKAKQCREGAEGRPYRWEGTQPALAMNCCGVEHS